MLAIAKRDIERGAFNFGERIGMGRIFSPQNQDDDIRKTKALIELLHDKVIDDREAENLLPYAEEICAAYIQWRNRENNECYVPPQQEALIAGVEQLAQETGDMAAVVDLAERFGWSFEQVLKMPYLDVFTIWKVDASRAKFQRRLNEVLKNRKSK